MSRLSATGNGSSDSVSVAGELHVPTYLTGRGETDRERERERERGGGEGEGPRLVLRFFSRVASDAVSQTRQFHREANRRHNSGTRPSLSQSHARELASLLSPTSRSDRVSVASRERKPEPASSGWKRSYRRPSSHRRSTRDARFGISGNRREHERRREGGSGMHVHGTRSDRAPRRRHSPLARPATGSHESAERVIMHHAEND